VSYVDVDVAVGHGVETSSCAVVASFVSIVEGIYFCKMTRPLESHNFRKVVVAVAAVAAADASSSCDFSAEVVRAALDPSDSWACRKMPRNPIH